MKTTTTLLLLLTTAPGLGRQKTPRRPLRLPPRTRLL